MITGDVRSPLKYVGGKAAAARRILAAFPAHEGYDTYHEPCGGAAHVLFAKPHWGHREIYNDLNDDLVNFWLQMQDRGEALAQRLQALPYSRNLYYLYHKRLFDGSKIDPLERAAMYFYVLRGTATGWIRESPGGWNNTMSNASAYSSLLETFVQVQRRLTQPRRVIIDNRDVERVLEEYDSPTTLHYVDPPYVGAEYYYQAGYRKHMRKAFDHAYLAAMLNQVQGMVVLSYYPHSNLERWYPSDRWNQITWQQSKPSTIPALGSEGTEEIQLATEMLLCNYPAPRARLSLWTATEEGEVSG
jgi:DNA adenine methylase